jgi:hypothetical protein
MSRVAAQTLATQVVHLLLARDVAVEVGESDEMHSDGLTIECHSSVASTSTIA